MLPTYIRFRDLKERGIVASWPQLKFMIDNYGFPPGRLASPQVRIWREDEVSEYLENPPFLPAQQRGAVARLMAKKAARTSDTEAA